MDELGAFSSETVLRLTKISRRRLTYWLHEGVLRADIEAGQGRGKVRVFSFQNLVEIRVALWLRDKVSLQLIRKIVAKLRETDGLDRPLAEVSFGVIEDLSGRGRARPDVVVKRADGGWERWESGQKIMEIAVPLRQFADEMRLAAEADRTQTRRVGEVERRRGVLGSAPVIAGTRIPVRAIWALHHAGKAIEEILADYPSLTADDVTAAVEAHERERAELRRRRTG
ncbi:MAG TPA: DUF433 domain-containing protein [Acidimicrobiales bacterium]|nr:DUF433 domain-containing protein [Acidimicrobiales bacterium]